MLRSLLLVELNLQQSDFMVFRMQPAMQLV